MRIVFFVIIPIFIWTYNPGLRGFLHAVLHNILIIYSNLHNESNILLGSALSLELLISYFIEVFLHIERLRGTLLAYC